MILQSRCFGYDEFVMITTLFCSRFMRGLAVSRLQAVPVLAKDAQRQVIDCPDTRTPPAPNQ
jgi:hypothetical protein